MTTPAQLYIEMMCDCGELILKSYREGTTKLRSKILLFDKDGVAKAVCKSCGKEHTVPVKLQKAFVQKPNVRHYVMEKVDGKKKTP